MKPLFPSFPFVQKRINQEFEQKLTKRNLNPAGRFPIKCPTRCRIIASDRKSVVWSGVDAHGEVFDGEFE